MTQDQVDSYIRTACTLIGGILMSSAGWSATQVASLTTGAIGVSGLVFLGASLYGSWKAHSVAGITAAAERTSTPEDKIAMAEKLPEVSRVVTTDAIANSPQFAANPTVVSYHQALTTPPPAPMVAQ